MTDITKLLGVELTEFEDNLKGTSTTSQEKIVLQANNMLEHLATMKKADDLNYDNKSGKQYWWGTKARKPVGSNKLRRAVKIKYQNKVLKLNDGDGEMTVENSVKAVKTFVEQVKAKVQSGAMDAIIAAEDARRASDKG